MLPIGQKLKSARERAGLSQADAALKADVGESSLSEFENDRRTPSLAQLDQLARVYSRSVADFMTTAEEPGQAVLWRDKPAVGAATLEVQFLRLAEQYANLETWSGEVTTSRLPQATKPSDTFDERDAEELAISVRRDLGLGDRPAPILLRVLEEDCGVKVFHVPFEPTGTAACARSERFGAAILLNASNVRWRRNYDLAHELFHLLTWNVFRSRSATSTDAEEKYADVFAATLLLPEEAVRATVSRKRSGNKLSTAALFEIARDFDVSIEALLWRLHTIYKAPNRDYTRDRITALRRVARLYEERARDAPPTRPDRFRALAVTALRSGEMSTGRFAEYLGVTRGEAMKYADEEASPDEALELPPP